MRTYMLMLSLVLTAMLAGCTHLNYYKDGATNADLKEDEDFCAGEAVTGYSSFGLGGALVTARAKINDCMKTRGWHRVE